MYNGLIESLFLRTHFFFLENVGKIVDGKIAGTKEILVLSVLVVEDCCNAHNVIYIYIHTHARGRHKPRQ